MKGSTIVVSFLLLLLFTLDARESEVLELEEEEVDDYLTKKVGVRIIEVYDKDDKTCKEFAEEYEKAAKEAKKLKRPYTFIKIEAQSNIGIGSKILIKGYPTIIILINSTKVDYERGYIANELLSFLDNKALSPLVHLKTAEELQEKFKTNELKVKNITNQLLSLF